MVCGLRVYGKPVRSNDLYMVGFEATAWSGDAPPGGWNHCVVWPIDPCGGTIPPDLPLYEDLPAEWSYPNFLMVDFLSSLDDLGVSHSSCFERVYDGHDNSFACIGDQNSQAIAMREWCYLDGNGIPIPGTGGRILDGSYAWIEKEYSCPGNVIFTTERNEWFVIDAFEVVFPFIIDTQYTEETCIVRKDYSGKGLSQVRANFVSGVTLPRALVQIAVDNTLKTVNVVNVSYGVIPTEEYQVVNGFVYVWGKI